VRSSILREIEALKGVTHAFVLTHDIDFLFVQGLVLRALRTAGEPALTVFADAGCAADSFEAQASLAVGLGQRYRLVPVALASRGRFHPKAVLLASPDEATLFVGSGNLTFGGWCDNGEVWTRFRTADGESSAISAFKAYLDELITGLPLADVLAAEVGATFDPASRAWANPLPEPQHLLGRLGNGPSLLGRLGDRLRAQHLTVCSPYFDPDGDALRLLLESSGATQTIVLTQESSTNLLPDALASWPPTVRTVAADYFHVSEKGERRRARLHAKWMLAVREDGRGVAVVGSANCSRAALTATGPHGNAELVVVVEGDANELASQLRAEIEVHDRPIELPAAPPAREEEDGPRSAEPVVLAASLDMGVLRVAFSAPEGFVAQKIEADGIALSTQRAASGELVGYPDGVPRRVRVVGLRSGGFWSTPECWVDVEALLRGSAGRRRLLDLVRQSQHAGLWNIEVWADLIDAAFEEIASPTPRGGGGGGARREDGALRTWHEDDVFLPSFSLSGSDSGGPSNSDADVVSSTLALLFNWSQGEEGIDRLDTVDEDEAGTTGGDDVLVEAGEGEEPDELPPKSPASSPLEVSPEKASKRQARAVAVLQKMLDTLADPGFLGTRSPADIRRAIIMLALLLRTGRHHGWLSGADFFAATQKAWRAVFFSGRTSETRGELAARMEREEDPEGFREALATPRLAAALAAWALAAHREGAGRDLARFDLTCAVSAAHHPWMWRGAALERISQELHRLIRHTYQAEEEALLGGWWPRVQRRGAALAAFERALFGTSPADLRGRLASWAVQPGALLWQGTAGWCVCEGSASSSTPDENISVRKLQGEESRREFRAGFLIPLRSLVEAMSDQLPEQSRVEIDAIITETALAYAGDIGPC
jgi:HKD family nuclease